MIKRYCLMLVSTVFLLTVFNASGQDPQFSQFYNNHMYYNPATAGISTDLRLTSSYRNLWSGISGLATYFISADYQFPNHDVGLGFLALNDNEGEHNQSLQRYEMFYTYQKQNAKSQFIAGMSIISLNIKKYNFNDFVFSDQLDPIHGNVRQSEYVNEYGEEPILYPDWNLGFLYRRNVHVSPKKGFTYTVGTSLSHLFFTMKNTDLYRRVELPPKLVLHGNMLIGFKYKKTGKFARTGFQSNMSKMMFFRPGIIFEWQDMFKTLTFGTGLDIYPMRFGMWFRNMNAGISQQNYNSVIFLTGVVIPYFNGLNNHNLILDYTYDSTVSKLGFASGGAHEISLIYNFSLPDNICREGGFNEWWRSHMGMQRN